MAFFHLHLSYTEQLSHLNLLPGFAVTIFAAPVTNARQMALGGNQVVFVGSLSAGKVYAVIPDKKTSLGTRVQIIAKDLKMPSGVAYHNGALFVAENDKILRFDQIDNNLQHPLPPTVIAHLPSEKHHGWRYLRFGPDGKLYVSIGAPCNVCLSKDKIFATIIRMDEDGRNIEIYAQGVRNSMGFDWHPIDHHLWFTDNGRDWMGDTIPPDELNVVTQKGEHFGFPYCHGKNILDPTYHYKFSCSDFSPPIFELPAHVAALGMTFYTGKQFPKEYEHQLFIAEHGSWNSIRKVGYQVVALKLQNNHVEEEKIFISGWLQGRTALGRPVDIINMSDGSLLVSDDYANIIYRVSFNQ